ncbi:hypothetical protein AMATHDRAFT_70257 [Amanita thiersii Skay4041]|uniref:Uncharacterized protein n=1 Tax=Amanita thiersii Skay4041 TaxID=703135 RepID=A0A2A9NEV6_9AGAR|nr:hypothetical protein AMATHDRAFT_70257 [Amanita thiersii Skay4041]
MSSKNTSTFTPPPKYINDFSKALASEVRILLAEVGKLRDERRALQYEIAELMSVKSKHGAGGEYSPDWRPKAVEAPPESDPPPALPAPPPEEPIQARPGWRSVNKRKLKAITAGPRTSTPTPAHVPAPVAQPMPEPRQELPAWAQWRPNPLLAPTPIAPTTSSIPQSPPQRPGIFGPPTPPPK